MKIVIQEPKPSITLDKLMDGWINKIIAFKSKEPKVYIARINQITEGDYTDHLYEFVALTADCGLTHKPMPMYSLIKDILEHGFTVHAFGTEKEFLSWALSD